MKMIIVMSALFFSTVVSAGCIYNGVEYPTGAVVDELTCGADGYWFQSLHIARSQKKFDFSILSLVVVLGLLDGLDRLFMFSENTTH